MQAGAGPVKNVDLRAKDNFECRFFKMRDHLSPARGAFNYYRALGPGAQGQARPKKLFFAFAFANIKPEPASQKHQT